MIYQLPNGKAIEISLEQYLDMTDEELEYLTAHNYGDAIDNPWFGSVLTKHAAQEPYYSEELEAEDLTFITNEEKLHNPDIDISAEED